MIPSFLALLGLQVVASIDTVGVPAPTTPVQEPPAAAGEVVEAPCAPTGLTGDWGGARSALLERGITIELSAILEANRVLGGGLGRSTTAHALYDLRTTFDLGRIAGLPDGILAVDAYAIDGHDPSEEAGDYQAFSDISGEETAQIGEVYYEQWFAEHHARLKLGKMDANSEFGSPSVMGEGIHSGTAYSPTAFTMVVYPNPAAGALAGYTFDENLTAKVGVFDAASARGVLTGSNGPSTLFGSPSDLLWMAQVERRWTRGSQDLPGGAVLGAWRHTGGDFTTVDGDSKSSTGGWYLALDQELAHEDRGDSVSNTLGILQFGWADGDIAPVDLHVGAGLTFNGFSASRPDDAIGVYGSWVRFGDDPAYTADAETAVELFYKWTCLPNVVLRPDLQYIVHPGGDDTVDDASVLSLRLELTF